MAKLILMRHGQSKWNELNLFTGWVDIPLSAIGIEESFEGGRLLKDIPIDVIFMSTLMRSQMTAMLAMSIHSSGKVPVLLHIGEGKLEEWAKIHSGEAEQNCIPSYCAWELNERMYGELQGMNKSEMVAQYGPEQVKLWRRSYDISPPNGESLKMTAARSIPYFQEKIFPFLKDGKNVFISAHGNSLRSIIMYLDDLTQTEVLELELATGVPILYEYDNDAYTKIND